MIAALLLTRVGGAHLHLCFDGGEAPATLHMEDAGVHHAESGFTQIHQDLDIKATGGLLGKLSLELLGLLFAVLLFWPLLWSSRKLIPTDHSSVFTPLLRFIRPPLRGPPSPHLA